MKNGKPPQEGIGLPYHFAGLFGQRLYFYNKTKKYTNKVTIDTRKCIACGKCVTSCPMQAITLLGKSVVEQGTIEKYL
ncbi:MAG: 4Fe-4S binding protein [Clostridium sp.]|nr:4Fe-4S binding protein [Clostridium sp.]